MKSFVIHGHFYQPFRENPYVGDITLEDSAFPFDNWNERIYRECYLPNAYAHYRQNGKTKRIVNNYTHMSFDMGWTLLYWLEKHHPELLEKIKEGSKNALAMSFNHTILPLDPEEDRLIQIRWGIRAFYHFFGRKPRGFWLPELAVDKKTLQILADEGIKYVILAHHQVKSRENFFRLELERGHIDVFVYDGNISHEVAFGRLLENAQELLNLLNRRSGLTLVATDGETFGHHKKFGEMGLSYMFLHSPDFTTLEDYYTFHEPRARGQVVEYTSWSCVHGIERWRSDCGCSTGGEHGWHQRWRKPLREGLEFLRKAIKEKVYNALGDYLREPEKAMLDFVDVILGKSKEDFLKEHAKRELSTQDKVRVFRFLNAIKYIHLAFSSDGWFFADISGIETVKNLLFAKRALDLSELGELENTFLEYLEDAESNIPTIGNGRKVWEKYVLTQVFTPEKIAKSVYLMRKEGILSDSGTLGKWKFQVEGDRIRLEDTETTEVYEYEGFFSDDLQDIPTHYAKRIYESRIIKYMESKTKQLQWYKSFLRYLLTQATNFRSLFVDYVKGEYLDTLRTQVYTLLFMDADFEEVEKLFKDAETLGLDILDKHIAQLLSSYVLKKIKETEENKVVNILKFVREINSKEKNYEAMINLWEAQNYVWENRERFTDKKVFSLLDLEI